jgi:hypothetical protein
VTSVAVEHTGLTAGDVARRLGVAVTTLRTWHQRYGLGPSGHSPGHHRRYTPEDLARLERMRWLTVAGVSPAESARRALGVAESPMAPRDGGGNAIPLGRSRAAARGLARAAMRLDAPAVSALVASAVNDSGVVDAWEDLLVPVLRGIGSRHASGGGLIEVEHVLSGCVSAVFAGVPRPVETRAPRILLACADEEQHSLPLEALGAALAQEGVPARLLGARVPARALRDAVHRTGPAAVVLWAHVAEHADPEQLTSLADLPNHPVLLVAAGPGWSGSALPAEVSSPGTLRAAVALLTGDSY